MTTLNCIRELVYAGDNVIRDAGLLFACFRVTVAVHKFVCSGESTSYPTGWPCATGGYAHGIGFDRKIEGRTSTCQTRDQ